MTPLREQLLTDMRARNLPQKLQERYVAEIVSLAKQTKKSPDLIAHDELVEPEKATENSSRKGSHAGA